MSQSPEKNLNFDPIEQRYVASCCPLPDRPGIDSCLTWRTTFTDYAQQLQPITIAIRDIFKPFPHLARLALNGLFDRITIQAYFEGLDFPETSGGVVFHNPGLYLFAKRLARHPQHNPPHEILFSVLDHVSGCSVKPLQLSTAILTDYTGIKKVEYNGQFLQLDRLISDFALVHGFDAAGRHQAIRYITPEEYQRFHQWFLARQASPENPFRFLKNNY